MALQNWIANQDPSNFDKNINHNFKSPNFYWAGQPFKNSLTFEEQSSILSHNKLILFDVLTE